MGERYNEGMGFATWFLKAMKRPGSVLTMRNENAFEKLSEEMWKRDGWKASLDTEEPVKRDPG